MSYPAGRPPIRVYRMALSGHCHRVELLLSLLAIPYETVDVNLAAGEQKKPEFLARNAFGQVPVIEDGDVTLADSNAILVYLEGQYAPGSWMPRDAIGAARVQRWLSVAAGQLAYGPAAARAIELFRRPEDPALARTRAAQLLTVMEQELANKQWLAADVPTLADIANYAYVARAPEGGVSLQDHPAVRAWLQRVEGLPRFLPFAHAPVKQAA
jgi:glutathione S-transferase